MRNDGEPENLSIPIPGYSRYRIDAAGNVYSDTRKAKGAALRPFLDSKGRATVNLIDDSGKRRGVRVHEVVMDLFVERKSKGWDIFHRDGDPFNCSSDNLEFRLAPAVVRPPKEFGDIGDEWVIIPGYSRYRINPEGDILSCCQSPAGKLLQPSPNEKGYPLVTLYGDDGKSRMFKVHRLVALVFEGPLPEGKVTRHLDGNHRSNNTPGNLTYGTYSENNFDQVEHGTHPEARRTHCDSGHEYTPENTMWQKSNKPGNTYGKLYRKCKTCHAIYVARWRARKKAGLV